MGGVRDYYFFFRSKESIRERLRDAMEALWLTAAMGALALLHFGAVFVYIARPSALGWSAFNLAAPIRSAGIVISIASSAGEILEPDFAGRKLQPAAPDRKRTRAGDSGRVSMDAANRCTDLLSRCWRDGA